MERKYISVFALNKYIKAKLNQDVSLQSVYIKGEISNYRPHPSGHLYFTLKDEDSCISAIMFASVAKKLDFQVENGMGVLIRAKVTVYEVGGQYQLNVQTMQQDGIGQLYLQFEKLKEKLEKEGLFDNNHKKPIPSFPKGIAVLSAKQGSAIQDVVKTIHLRFPFTRVIVFPIPVQGKNAYLKIIETLQYVDKLKFDTIILARGGGTIENLWNFNEESLARCIYECQTPVISGIGHETDFTICDFVSDYRGVTPTAAAVKATPDQQELKKYNQQLFQQLVYKMKNRIDFQKQYLSRLTNSYYLTNPEALFSNEIFRLSRLQEQLSYHFQMFYLTNRQDIVNYQTQMKQLLDKKLQLHQHKLQQSLVSLDALSPLKVMQRGYTLVKSQEKMIKRVEDIHKGDVIEIQFYDGITNAEIK